MLIGVACEDHGHFLAATKIISDEAISRHDWLEGVIETVCHWRGVEDGRAWSTLDRGNARDLKAFEFEGQRIQPIGHIDGRRLEPEASMWRKVLLAFCQAQPQPEVVVLVRDLDGYAERRRGLEQVRDGLKWPFKIIAAMAQPEIEAWHVAGFEPDTETEKTALVEVRDTLSFDPRLESHRLTSHPNDAPTDAKRVLERLCGRDSERVLACLNDRQRLRERGQHNGLVGFLDEVERRIVPLFGGKGP